MTLATRSNGGLSANRNAITYNRLAGFHLIVARTERKLSQKDIANNTGLSQTIVSRVERGHIELSQLSELCRLYQIKPSLLLSRVDDSVRSLKDQGVMILFKNFDEDTITEFGGTPLSYADLAQILTSH